ncbi:PGAP1-like alpha/beta domain-containing protein [Demequina gelatinilytica]|uniref:PGAP1-like alpha/beta domain-containing protein n=1 Tax=Demequina gelatinilytica TaxID=1638980 RepID=UPI0007816D9D|nr:hypothetical protein [Demequina gelatinilytica]
MSEPAWTRGGRGGSAAVLGDLEVAVGALREAADGLGEAALALATAALVAPQRAPGLQGPAIACSREAEELRELSRRLRAAVDAYRAAESDAHHGVSAATYALDVLGDQLGRLWLGTREAVLRGPAGLIGALPRMPTTGTVNEATATIGLGLTGDAYGTVVAHLRAAVRAAERSLEPALTGVQVDGPGFSAGAPRTVEELMGRLEWLGDQGDGRVAIETVTDAAGPHHLVYIPGTQDPTLWDASPADVEADLAAVTGEWCDAAQVVVEAMRAHGIGADEPVMLVGHSQGGMIAAVVSATLSSTYRITQIVTAGSPTGRIALPSSVDALQLENLRDVVPGLDGRPNPATPTRTTVTHDRRHSAQDDAPDASHTVLQAHGIPGYAQTARLVDGGLDPSTRAWVEGAAPMLAGGRSQIRLYAPVTGASAGASR